MKFIHINGGKEVAKGDTVTNGTGETMTVTGWAPPYKPAAQGRIYIQNKDGEGMEAFPKQYGCKFVKP